ncbi:hypothetical protein [Pusillimonas sp. ANT_WB101]|nr:hypothetical protein [Pusillimonas sp. ANT_WB101]
MSDEYREVGAVFLTQRVGVSPEYMMAGMVARRAISAREGGYVAFC